MVPEEKNREAASPPLLTYRVVTTEEPSVTAKFINEGFHGNQQISLSALKGQDLLLRFPLLL